MPTTTTTKTAERRGGGASVPRSTRLVVLLTASLLSAAVADAFDRVNGTRLAAIADGFRQDWPTTRARSGQVKMRLRPDGAPSSWSSDSTVCGYDFTAEAAAVDGAVTRRLPAAAAFLCGDDRDEYLVGLPAPDAVYEAVAFLGEGAHPATVRLETAGQAGVPLTDLCFGFVDGGAVRAFCADVELLIACRRWKGLRDDLDFGLNNVQLRARRKYSVREFVFRDVRALPAAFESLARNTADEAAAREVCQRIGFTDAGSRTHEGCLGRRVTASGDGGTPSDREFRFTSRGLLVDADDTSYACERSVANTEQHDDGGGGPRTSGGRASCSSASGFLFLSAFVSISLRSAAA